MLAIAGFTSLAFANDTATAVSVVSQKDFSGTMTIDYGDVSSEEPNTTITLSQYSDDTYGIFLANFGASEGNPTGMGDVDLRGLVLDGTKLTGKVEGLELELVSVFANIDVDGTYDETDLELHLDVNIYDPFDMPMVVEFTTKTSEAEPDPTEKMSFRRKYTDGSSRYYNYLGYTVNGETTELYSVANPSTEDYYVTPQQNVWQTEGAYIDFTDKVIEVPANADNFTMIMKSNSSVCSSKWSQNAVLIDWNNNGVYNEEGETNGVINIDKKANETGGALVITAEGEKDEIILPESLEPGDVFHVLITMNEPKGVEGTQDLWSTHWDWTKEIFADNTCSLINGQAYGLKLRVTEPTTGIDNITTDDNANAETEYYTIQGIKVSADNLTPGFYVARKGNKAYKILVK